MNKLNDIEVTQGVTIHKVREDDTTILFKASNFRFNIVELVVDLTGSDISIKDRAGYIVTATLYPFETKDLCRVMTYGAAAIRTEFKFTLKPPPNSGIVHSTDQ